PALSGSGGGSGFGGGAKPGGTETMVAAGSGGGLVGASTATTPACGTSGIHFKYIDHEKRAFKRLACARGQYIPILYGEVTVLGSPALAMEHIYGETLEKRIPSLGESDKDWIYSLDGQIREPLSKGFA
ncbi:hypothetical protein LTR17_027833, partial [Elasticomyces elasticus]